MGALTSKPFSFAARSWELLDRLAFDCTDTFFSPLKVSFRGSSIMRILPDFTTSLLSEWISDRVRFSYDAVHNQPDYDFFYKFRVSNLSQNLLHFFLKRFPANSYFFDFVSAHQIKAVSDFSGFSRQILNNFFYLNFDIRSAYTFDFSQILTKQIFKNYFLFGLNFRYQLPVFAVHLRRLAVSSETFFFNFGSFTNNLLGDINIGSSLKLFQSTVRGKSKVSRLYHSNASVSFSNPFIYQFLSSYSSNPVYTFFDSPKSLISAEVSSAPLNFSFFDFFIHLPHFFLFNQIFPRNSKLQKFNSLVFAHETAYNFLFFSKRFLEFSISYNFNFKLYSGLFMYDNYYSHYSADSISKTSLNLLLAVKRQSSSRSSFIYYN